MTKREPWDEVYDRINYRRSPDWVAAPPATDAELDRVEGQLGSPLPRSYRAFMGRFGSGDLGGIFRLAPIGSLVDVTSDHRELFTTEKQVNTEWLGRVVYFANNSGGEHYVWDPMELAHSQNGECPIYWLPRHEEEHPRRQADTFYKLIDLKMATLRKLMEEEPEEQLENPFEPYYLRLKEQPDSAAVADWLTFNNHTVRDLALAIRDHGRTDAFPILADALQEAGCTNADLLDTCRTGDPDIDGKWALQILLGKE